jgi:hypothetical protein
MRTSLQTSQNERDIPEQPTFSRAEYLSSEQTNHNDSIVQSLDRQREKGQQKVTVKHLSILTMTMLPEQR